MERGVGATTRALERFADSEWVERMGRIGLVTKGVSFGIVGVLAILLALDVGGAATDREGALRLLSKEPWGFVLILAIGLGFGAYAAWRLAQAIFDRDDEGTGFKGWAKRAGCLVKGVFYGGLSVLAFSFLTGPRGESSQEPEQTARIFELPLGRWVVFAAGAGLLGYGLWNGFRSITGRFEKHMKKGQMEREDVRPAVKAVGFAGHLARMLLFGMVGFFLLRAAWQHDAGEAIGFDGALVKLANQENGSLWLAGVAAGLFAYGLFAVFQARYRDI